MNVVCTECRPLMFLSWRRQFCLLHYHRLMTSCIPSRGSNLNTFLFTMKSPATMSMPHNPGHCPRISLPKFPFATVFLKSCHLRSWEWFSKSERSLRRAIRNLELMKHRRFHTVYWRAHVYRSEENRLPRRATDLQCTARGRTDRRPKRIGYIDGEKPNAEERLKPWEWRRKIREEKWGGGGNKHRKRERRVRRGGGGQIWILQ